MSNIQYRSGLFTDTTSADSAYQDLLDRNYKPEEINIIMSEATKNKYSESQVAQVETGNKSLKGLAVGGAVGGTVLGAITAIIAISSNIVIPGLGLVLIGPLAAGLVGAGAGSIAGGILGALIGAGIPEEHAKIYEDGIKDGGIVILVPSRGDDDRLLLEDWKKKNPKYTY